MRWDRSLTKSSFTCHAWMNWLFQEVRSLKSALLDWNQGASWNTVPLQIFSVFSWLLAFLNLITLSLCICVYRCLCMHGGGIYVWRECGEREETGTHRERAFHFSKNTSNDMWSLLRRSKPCLYMFISVCSYQTLKLSFNGTVTVHPSNG